MLKLATELKGRRNAEHADSDRLQFEKSRKSILKTLSDSKDRGTVVGIYAAALGEGMFITSVEDIYKDDDEEIIVFKRYDISGIILNRTDLSINEINRVCPFNQTYKNPVLNG